MRSILGTGSLSLVPLLLGLSLWRPPAAGAGFPLSNDPSPLAICQDTIRTASIRLASEARRAVSACVTAGVECVVDEPGELDDCCRTAARRCRGRLERVERAQARFATYVVNRRCAEVAFADVLAPSGLGYESIAGACAALTPPATIADLGGLADCLARLLVAETTCDIGASEIPRGADALACLVLDAPRALEDALDLSRCAASGGATPTPGVATPTPVTSATPVPTTSSTVVPSVTAIATATVVATATAVPTATTTPVATLTTTPARTTTPTAASTATSTAVATVQASPTPTRTATPSASPTTVATTTAVPTASTTITAVPTVVATATVTATPVRTATTTPLPTSTPTVTATPVLTATPVRTATVTPIPTTTPVLTATAIPTATRTPTPVATTTPTGPVCGNGVQESGESCDDGNTSNCDSCPKNCVASTAPVACSATTVRHAQRVRLQAPTGAVLSGGQICLDYPSGVVALPGTGNVTGRTSNLSGLVTLNDFNNAVQLTFVANPGAAQVNPTISFDLCTGQTAPLPAAFSCEVKSASNAGTAIDPTMVTCTPITIP